MKTLDCDPVQTGPEDDPRDKLVAWMTDAKNPFFAKAVANRYWAHFFGRGIVDPLDDMRVTNPPSNPELLDALAKDLVEHKYSLKQLIRTICNSRTYQLSSGVTHPSQNDPRLFARMAVKGMSGEQLYDSLAVATGFQERLDSQRPGPFFSPRAEFLTKFANPSDKRTEHQTSILQALTLMNGKLTNEVTNPGAANGPPQTLTLVAVMDAPFFDTPAKQVEALYLATLSRKPRSFHRGGTRARNWKTASSRNG